MARVSRRGKRAVKRRKSYRRSKRPVGRPSRAVKSVTRMRMRSTEWKYFDVARPGADPTNPGGTVNAFTVPAPGATLFQTQVLNDVPSGSAVTQRDGRTITIRKCVGHVEVQSSSPTLPVEYCDFRCAIVLDRQSNGNMGFLAQDLWGMKRSDGAADGTSAIQTNLRNMDNINRFAILWERRFDMAAAPPMAPAAGQPNGSKSNYHKSLSFYLHNLNFTTQYSSAGQGAITTNALYFVVWADTAPHAGSTTSGRVLTLSARTTFTDK